MFDLISKIFTPFIRIFKFINDHFKAMLFLLLLYFIFAANSQDSLKIANLTSINLHGMIQDTSEILQNIQKAQDDNNIKGVLLNVNSPGGALAPSVELSLAIKELSKKKPVVAYASGSMTSGSYYASIWTDKIYANPGSFIGSIGVIFQAPNIKSLADKLGVKEQVIKAGKFKQAGTFTREWTDEEKQSLKTLVDDAYKMFVADVAFARGLDINKTNDFADAKVFLSSKAKEVGLIDEVGSISEAKEYLQKIAKVNEPIWQEPDFVEKLTSKLASKSAIFLQNYTSGLRAE